MSYRLRTEALPQTPMPVHGQIPSENAYPQTATFAAITL
jgi:hypothetical protein